MIWWALRNTGLWRQVMTHGTRPVNEGGAWPGCHPSHRSSSSSSRCIDAQLSLVLSLLSQRLFILLVVNCYPRPTPIKHHPPVSHTQLFFTFQDEIHYYNDNNKLSYNIIFLQFTSPIFFSVKSCRFEWSYQKFCRSFLSSRILQFNKYQVMFDSK